VVPQPAFDGPPTSSRAALVSEVDLTGVSVLIVEDNADARELVATGLAEAGAWVRTAASAHEATRALATDPTDVVVIDISMPGEDGYSLLGRLRAAGVTIPAIALTAHVGEDDRRRTMRAGFDVHVGKPFELQELRRVVSRLGRRADSDPRVAWTRHREP